MTQGRFKARNHAQIKNHAQLIKKKKSLAKTAFPFGAIKVPSNQLNPIKQVEPGGRPPGTKWSSTAYNTVTIVVIKWCTVLIQKSRTGEVNDSLHILLGFFLFCREEENLVFCFGALFNSTLNFTQSGWHILFSPDLHFRLAKRVSGQTHSLRLETATRTDLSLVAPA